LLDLARSAQRLFARQEPREKRRLLTFVLLNCTWQDGEIAVTFRQPFDISENNGGYAVCAHRR
jgi:site-specific DNA recombinase